MRREEVAQMYLKEGVERIKKAAENTSDVEIKQAYDCLQNLSVKRQTFLSAIEVTKEKSK